MRPSEDHYQLPAQQWLKATAQGPAVRKRLLENWIVNVSAGYLLGIAITWIMSITTGEPDWGPTRVGGIVISVAYLTFCVTFVVRTSRKVHYLRSIGWTPPSDEASLPIERPDYARMARNATIFLVVVAAFGVLIRLA